MKKYALILGIFGLCFLTLTAQANATTVPPLVNYQGMLTDADGNPMSGTKQLEFNLYDAASGGNKIWGPQVFNSVPLVGGKFNVILGTTDNSGRSISEAFTEKERYLGIKVNNGSELAPRQQILSAPFALQAEHAQNAKNADKAKQAESADNADMLQGKGLDELFLREPDFDTGWFDVAPRQRTYTFELGFKDLPRNITAYYRRENGQIFPWGLSQYGSHGILLDFDGDGEMFVRLSNGYGLHMGYYWNREDSKNELIYHQENLDFRVMLWK